MTSLVRPLLPSILCCMIACGHAPAWLHVGSCEDGCGDVVVAEVSSTACSHGCCHQSADATDSDKPATETRQPATPSDQHDSDTCPVCQSLAGSVGVVTAAETTLALEDVCELVFIGADQDPVVAPCFIAQPRGPPAVA